MEDIRFYIGEDIKVEIVKMLKKKGGEGKVRSGGEKREFC
jgi:hypothetical protein